jgi:P-type E1-E2 ATPase
MISLDIPGVGSRQWAYLALDLNGTLTVDGGYIPGVPERLQALSRSLSVRFITADTRGTARALAETLGIDWVRVERGQEAEQKRRYIESLGAEQVIAVGNGNNDASMLSQASLGIAVLGPEGTASRAILGADIVAANIVDALDLLLKPTRLLSTLRA